jgi:hypothetical protein
MNDELVVDGVTLLEGPFLQPGKALYLYNVDAAGTQVKGIYGTPPKSQLDVDYVMRDVFDEYASLHSILMSPQDFKAYNDACVAKKTIQFGPVDIWG